MMRSICLLVIFVAVARAFTARFCTLNNAEDMKCQWMRSVLMKREEDLPPVECIRGQDSYDCLQMTQDGRVDVTTKNWVVGLYQAGKNHNLVPLLRENTNKDSSWTPAPHYIVSVVRRGSLSNVKSLADLRGARACHPGVYSLGGWQVPVGRLAERGLLPRTPCRDALAAVAYFFNESCAPGMSAVDRRRLPTLCALCKGVGEERCTHRDPYSGYSGAVICVQEGTGEIAFVRHLTFDEMLQKDPNFAQQKQDLELLCLDGSRKPLDNYQQCNWGAIVDSATIVSANMTSEHRTAIKDLLKLATQVVPNIFNSSAFGGRNALFYDETLSLDDVGDRDDYIKYIGDYYDIAENQYPCSEPTVKFCVISEAERLKCRRWNDALTTRLLKPNVECLKVSNKDECLRLMREGKADATLMSVEQIYKQKDSDQFKVVMSEAYNKLDGDATDLYDWALAVVKNNSSREDFTFQNIAGKKSCHASVNSLTSWRIPAVTLSVLGQISWQNPCQIREIMKQFFNQSCVLGINSSNKNFSSLCNLCEGEGSQHCSETTNEPFYGEEGALRCLTSGAGDVAFLKYSTLVRNVDGRNSETWAENLRLDDFKLLCTDGSKKSVHEYKKCSLATVPTSALVIRTPLTDDDDDIYSRIIYLFRQSQTFYGGGENPNDFNMFRSGPKDRDLIFTDRIAKLQELPERLQDPEAYVQNVKGYFQSTDEDRCSSAKL